jgi:general secretion pathway protein I
VRRGFTLLEVVVALAILSLALMAIFDMNAGAVASHAYAKRLTVATMLARSKMTDIEQELYDKGFDIADREISGDFRAEGWEAYTWKAQILAPQTTEVSPDKLIESLFNLPPGANGVAGLAALLGSGRDGGIGGATGGISQQLSQYGGALGGAAGNALPPGATQASGLAALGPFAGLAQTQMTNLLQQIQKGVREVHLTVSWKDGKRTESVDFVTDVFSLRQGSDRNGTPGAALNSTAGVPGAPGTGVPGAPGTGVPGPGGVPGNPFAPGGLNTGGQSIFSGPTTGNTPQGTPLDPSGRPIR